MLAIVTASALARQATALGQALLAFAGALAASVLVFATGSAAGTGQRRSPWRGRL